MDKQGDARLCTAQTWKWASQLAFPYQVAIFMYLLLKIYFLIMCMYLFVHMRLEEETFDPLELNHMVWVLGTELSPL